MSEIYQVMAKKRGEVIAEEQREGQPLVDIKCYLPVAESFGFDSYLREKTSGKAFPQCVFSHYALIDADPLKPDSMSNKVVLAIRKRKGLKEGIPVLSDYEDKM